MHRLAKGDGGLEWNELGDRPQRDTGEWRRMIWSIDLQKDMGG